MICITCGTQFSPPQACPECHWDADAQLSPDSVCAPGDTLESQYTVVSYLGSGRFGVSFQAIDLTRNQNVVLKFIHTAFLPTPPHYKRFVDGMSLVRDTANPAVAGLFDVGMLNRRVFIATELMNGGSLAELFYTRCQSGPPFTLQEIYPVLTEVASALIECPTMFHGAVCPENIFIESGRVRVTECGLAANLPESVIMRRLSSTPDRNRYVAPEIQNGSGIGARSDVYSLCVILGEMLTLETYRNDPAQMTEAVARYEPDIAEIVSSALAENPRDRFRDAETLLTALSDLAGLPAPNFNRSWADGELAASSGTGTQEDKTAQIVMKDVIQQHFEEVTSVRRNPLLDTPASSSPVPTPPDSTALAAHSAAHSNELNMHASRPSFPAPPKPSSASGAPAAPSSIPPSDNFGDSAGLFSAGPPPSAVPALDMTSRSTSGSTDPGNGPTSVSTPGTPSPIISLDDTDSFETLEDITDEFEALQEEMLENISYPNDSVFRSTKHQPVSADEDEEKTINDRGILSVRPEAPTTEAIYVNEATGEPEPQTESAPLQDENGIDPRFLRAAEKLKSAPPPLDNTEESDRLNGINPRFLRAAMKLKESQVTDNRQDRDDESEASGEDEDWRTRIEQEIGAASESMVSFMPTGQTAMKKMPTQAADVTASESNTIESSSHPGTALPSSQPPLSAPKSQAPPPPPRVATRPAAGGMPSPSHISDVPAQPAAGIRSAAPPPPPPPARKP